MMQRPVKLRQVRILRMGDQTLATTIIRLLACALFEERLRMRTRFDHQV